MKRILFVLALLMMSGCIGKNSEELMNSYSRASYKDDALGFLENSPAYHDSGYRATCADATTDIDNNWVVSCFFNSKDSNGGVSTHNVTIKYDSGGKMIEAMADGKYNMIGVKNV